MEAIVTAGGIPEPGEPLYEYTKGISKAMLDVAGKPMIQWVLDALDGSEKIDHIVVVGLSPETAVVCNKPLDFIPNQGNMLANVIAGAHKVLELNPKAGKILSVSSDVPTITTKIVDWMVEQTQQIKSDVLYNVVTREAMENRFPGSKRSFVHFRDIEICGGDVTSFRADLVTSDKGEVLRELIGARKSVFKQAAILGWGTLILLLLRRLTLEGAAERASRALRLVGKAIVCPYPEIAMDIDKPYQLELLANDLRRRTAS